MTTLSTLIHTEPPSTVLCMLGLLAAAALQTGRISVRIRRISIRF